LAATIWVIWPTTEPASLRVRVVRRRVVVDVPRGIGCLLCFVN
jgi:hypothetical protein